MHNALLLPEIVAAIVKSESGEPGYLHTCLLINRQFYQESCRILWYGCGSSYNSATAGHVTPGIRQLAEISQRSRQRARLYADFVNILFFAEPEETWPYGDEAAWHGDLTCLQYPQLQEVAFYPSDKAASLNKGDAIIYYAQPSLHTFRLCEGTALSDAFLDDLRTRCPQLQHLDLTSSANTMTQDGLLRFLGTFNSLQSLKLDTGFRDLWSHEAFRSVGRYTNLEMLYISIIEDGWLQGDEALFPALKHLSTRMSTRGLSLLSSHVPNLTSIHATILSPCTSIEAFVDYPRLRDLVVEFEDGGSFSGKDLLLIAENCPGLQLFEVRDEGARPQIEGLDDSMMEKIASALPNIRELKLNKIDTGEKPLTMQSIKSLGSHCPNLKELVLSSISIDWDEGDGTISDSIWSLDLDLCSDHTLLWPEDYDEDEDDGAHVTKEQIAEMAERFGRRFPNMEYFNVSGGGEGEEQLNDRLGDFIGERG
ncbi:hypothetical protein PG993_014808 [Apiospora rasikravindrae]|uniref:F-box domain-containing protein n=1 Tax=Apiospora rasikravindrae TaxID=990691 RepID=A0ABR1RNS7_9PEZI